ncbi:unnamed protein product [Alopecurus aequalis]
MHGFHSIARVRSIGGRRMVHAKDSQGVGYDWRQIQWLNFHGHRWMYLERPHVPLPYPDYPYSCIHCGDKGKKGFSYCSIRCQADHVPGGNGIARATNLLAANWEQLDCDTYCVRCNRAFASTYCGLHLELHHANQAAATIQIFHRQGWVLVAADQNLLLAAIFQDVQVVDVDGVAMHPIHSRPPQQQVPPVANGTHPCAGPCFEGIPVGAQFCSLRCHQVAE